MLLHSFWAGPFESGVCSQNLSNAFFSYLVFRLLSKPETWLPDEYARVQIWNNVLSTLSLREYICAFYNLDLKVRWPQRFCLLLIWGIELAKNTASISYRYIVSRKCYLGKLVAYSFIFNGHCYGRQTWLAIELSISPGSARKKRNT